MKCPICGEKLQKTDKFCTTCGRPCESIIRYYNAGRDPLWHDLLKGLAVLGVIASAILAPILFFFSAALVAMIRVMFNHK